MLNFSPVKDINHTQILAIQINILICMNTKRVTNLNKADLTRALASNNGKDIAESGLCLKTLPH